MSFARVRACHRAIAGAVSHPALCVEGHKRLLGIDSERTLGRPRRAQVRRADRHRAPHDHRKTWTLVGRCDLLSRLMSSSSPSPDAVGYEFLVLQACSGERRRRAATERRIPPPCLLGAPPCLLSHGPRPRLLRRHVPAPPRLCRRCLHLSPHAATLGFFHHSRTAADVPTQFVPLSATGSHLQPSLVALVDGLLCGGIAHRPPRPGSPPPREVEDHQGY